MVVEPESDTESEDPAEVVEPVERQELTEGTLNLCWLAFAEKMREDRPRMAVTLKSVNPRITENSVIMVELNNGAQLDDFNNSIKGDLEKYLKREMHNSDISIQAVISESNTSEQPKFYTSEEKFRYLSQKNPELVNFRQKLNLELE